jgi:hypothetical protein
MANERNEPTIGRFQRSLFRECCGSLNLPRTYKYLYGSPVQPIVPIDTHQDGVFILGAYPSARFASLAGERDVPVGDNCGHFQTNPILMALQFARSKAGMNFNQNI